MKKRTIDRRIIFLIMLIGVAIPLIFPIGFPVETSPNVRKVYKMVKDTPAGSTVLISFDYDPASMPELQPMAKALLRHCFRKHLKVVITALWPMGVSMAANALDGIKEEFPKLKYGVDYVNMGYKAGGMVTIQAMGKNFKKVFPRDNSQTPVSKLPILNRVNNFSNFAFIISLSAGTPGIKEWVMVAHDKYGIKTSGGTTAVSAPALLPYVNEQNQLYGLLGGLKGAAEYEKLIKKAGSATSGMDAQSIGHLVIIFFIILANLNYYKNKKKKEV